MKLWWEESTGGTFSGQNKLTLGYCWQFPPHASSTNHSLNTVRILYFEYSHLNTVRILYFEYSHLNYACVKCHHLKSVNLKVTVTGK